VKLVSFAAESPFTDGEVQPTERTSRCGHRGCTTRNRSGRHARRRSRRDRCFPSARRFGRRNGSSSPAVRELTRKTVETARRLGASLCAAGYGLITGGWPGVDHEVTSGYAALGGLSDLAYDAIRHYAGAVEPSRRCRGAAFYPDATRSRNRSRTRRQVLSQDWKGPRGSVRGAAHRR
jgi:hypothetical protein